MKYHLKFLAILLGLIIIVALGWSYVASTVIKQVRKNYESPDTTITYKNGQWDTVITKKTIPSWLK